MQAGNIVPIFLLGRIHIQCDVQAFRELTLYEEGRVDYYTAQSFGAATFPFFDQNTDGATQLSHVLVPHGCSCIDSPVSQCGRRPQKSYLISLSCSM